MHPVPIFSATMLALLASGCCLPEISGRCEPCIATAKTAHEVNKAESPKEKSWPGYGGHSPAGRNRGRIGHWLGSSDGPGTPPGQVVPLPKFHPVPTHPVFEPLPEYAPPLSLGPAAQPLEPRPPAELLPTPAQPVADPA